MGAGQAVGAIDNPIQREMHASHPLAVGHRLRPQKRGTTIDYNYQITIQITVLYPQF